MFSNAKPLITEITRKRAETTGTIIFILLSWRMLEKKTDKIRKEIIQLAL
jgi:hypothetical protein